MDISVHQERGTYPRSSVLRWLCGCCHRLLQRHLLLHLLVQLRPLGANAGTRHREHCGAYAAAADKEVQVHYACVQAPGSECKHQGHVLDMSSTGIGYVIIQQQTVP